VESVVQFFDTPFSVIVLAQFPVRQVIAGLLGNGFDLRLDQPD
jgi:hypothetical protein